MCIRDRHIHMHIHACSHTLVYTCVGAHTCRHMYMHIQRVDTGNEARVVLCTSVGNDCGCSKLVYTHSGSVQFSSVRLCTPDHAHVHTRLHRPQPHDRCAAVYLHDTHTVPP